VPDAQVRQCRDEERRDPCDGLLLQMQSMTMC
jgi:hypothetical protein